MPQVAVGAAASGLIAGLSTGGFMGLTGLAAGLAAFGTSMVLGGISYALTPKAKKAAVTTPQNTVAVRQSDLSRQVIYGHTRITRGYAHMSSTEVNGKLHVIVILCEGTLRAINEVWLNDYAIPPDWIDADGNVTQGRYAGKLVIRKHLGTLGQAADSLAIQNMPEWTADHRLQGIAYMYLIMTKDQDVYPNGLPNISAVVEGVSLYDPRLGVYTWTSNIALMAADFIRNPDYGFAAFEDDIDDDNTSAQANICDEMVDVQPKEFTVSSVNAGTDIITLSGDLLTLQFGDRVEISSTGTLPGGLNSGTDYFVIPYQVKDTPRLMLATSLANSMNKTAIDITTAGTGTIKITKTAEPRYHGAGVIDTDSDLTDTLNGIVTSMAGRAICTAGFWTVVAGAWRAPVLNLGIDDIRGTGIGVKNCLSMADSYNVVSGMFISPDNLYQQSNYTPARYQQFIDQDNGIEQPKTLDLGFCSRRETALRIAKIELFRGRQDISYTSDFSLKAMLLQPADVAQLSIEALGWENKNFEVTQFGFTESAGALSTSLGLRETAAEIYDWSSGEAVDRDPAPNTSLPSPYAVQVVSGLSFSSRFVETVDGDALYTLTIRWSPHPNAFVIQYGDFEVQYKLSAETEWRPSFLVPGEQVQTDVTTSTVNIPYDIRIRARNNLGARSGWNAIFGAVVGSSGGVSAVFDFGGVEFPPDSYVLDYGSVEDAPTEFQDWGYVN